MSGDPRALLGKADKALSSVGKKGWLSSTFGGPKEDEYEAAADLYTEAANAFRAQENYNEAGQAFEKAADIQFNKIEGPNNAATSYYNAFKAYKQSNPEKAVQCIRIAIQACIKKGDFRGAAQHQERAGGVLETEIGDIDGALEAYEKAAGWFQGDGATALGNKLWLKVAEILGLRGLGDDYIKASKIYGKIAKETSSDNLMRYSVKNYLLKQGIVNLASGDLISAKRGLAHATEEIDPQFATTREYQLLDELNKAVEANNQEEFEDALFKFDQIQRLDNWQTKLLLRIKNSVFEPEDFS